MPKQYNTPELLDNIRRGDNATLRLLYKEGFHYCTGFVRKNDGTPEDAREIFQESLLVLLKKVQDPLFSIEHNIWTYLYAVCKNLWLKQLRQRKSKRVLVSAQEEEIDDIQVEEDTLFIKQQLEDRLLKMEDCVKKLKAEGKQLLHLTFFQKLTDKAIAPLMGYSFMFVRQKRKRIIKSLRKCMGI